MMRAWIGLVPFARSSVAKRSVAEHHCLQSYCGAALRQMRALITYKRARRGFFRLLLASWQQWARQHRREMQAEAAALKVQSGPLHAAARQHAACNPTWVACNPAYPHPMEEVIRRLHETMRLKVGHPLACPRVALH